MSRFCRDSTAEPFYDWVGDEVSLAGESDWKLGSQRSAIKREVQFRGGPDISGFGGLGRFLRSHTAGDNLRKCPVSHVSCSKSPTRTRALHFQTSIPPLKTYDGEWALVGEFVKQLGQFALGEFWHPAIANTHFLAEAARATRMTWKRTPPSGPVTE
jgi:hypothetical protein